MVASFCGTIRRDRSGHETVAMESGLPVGLDDLIHARSVEDNRREFKAVWNPATQASVVRTVCAFANDLLNLNGGYVILGVETDDRGNPVLPPRGLEEANLDRIQREILGQCNRIYPSYHPILFPATYADRPVLVIWAPGGDNRPYEAPKTAAGSDRAYYVREGSETVAARGALRSQLFEQAAKIPFDDRINRVVGVDDVSERLVKRFLADIGSEIGRTIPFSRGVYSRMQITSPLNAHEAPRNVALLFFTDDPHHVFPGAQIDLVQFADDAGGDLIEERTIRGPLHHQVGQTLSYLESLGITILEKVSGRAEVERMVTYPFEAIREAVVNAVYHRSYQEVEPTKVYLYPDRMEVTSYPGPVHGVELFHFDGGSAVPAVPARNRRIGGFLKELKLAESRGTGVPKIRRHMRESGSPEPRFDFDSARTYFRVILPVHPRYRVIHALRESAMLWATGKRREAVAHLARAADDQPGSGAVAGQLIEYAAALDDLQLGKAYLDRFDLEENRTEVPQPYLRYGTALLNRGQRDEARAWLGRVPVESGRDDLLEAAILSKRAGDYRAAHRLFDELYARANDDAKVVHEFARTKIALARAARHRDLPARKRLNRQAAALLRRAIPLTDDPVRKAWCWFDLAGTLAWLREPESGVEHAYRQALALQPDEERFAAAFRRWRSTRTK